MFYTYSHSAPNGNIFYIGKGKADRAFSFSDRSHDWKRAVKKYQGVSINILSYWDTEEEAFEHEKFLIDCFQGLNYLLVNKTKGGKGVFGYTQTEELKQKKSELMTGFKYKQVVCPHCQTKGGETSMKRWHFKNCTGAKNFKARVSVNGRRVFLGNYASKADVALVVEKYFKEQT
jgi:hypothetical protein